MWTVTKSSCKLKGRSADGVADGNGVGAADGMAGLCDGNGVSSRVGMSEGIKGIGTGVIVGL